MMTTAVDFATAVDIYTHLRDTGPPARLVAAARAAVILADRLATIHRI